MRDGGVKAFDRAAALGYGRFRLSLGESHRFDAGWADAAGMRRQLEALPDAANSGDVYAVRDGHPALAVGGSVGR